MDKTSVNEANTKFAQERREIANDYRNQVATLQAELSAKVKKLQYERDKKLLDLSKRQDKFHEEYRQWKREQWLKYHENEQLNNE